MVDPMRWQPRLILKLIAFIVALNAAGIALDAGSKALRIEVYSQASFHILDVLAVLSATGLLLWLEGRSFRDLGLGLNWRWLRNLGIGFIFACALMLLASLGVPLTQGAWIRTGSGTGPLLRGLAACMGVATFEEVAFRGYPFQRMVEAWGAMVALPFMALLFVIPHLAAGHLHGFPASTLALSAINLALAGALLGMAFLRTRSLALSIGIHWGWNWMQGAVLGLGVSGARSESFLIATQTGPKASWITGDTYGPEASLPGILAVLIGIAVLLWKVKAIPNGLEPASRKEAVLETTTDR